MQNVCCRHTIGQPVQYIVNANTRILNNWFAKTFATVYGNELFEIYHVCFSKRDVKMPSIDFVVDYVHPEAVTGRVGCSDTDF